ncbi:hypothetical protein K503DRAFT_776043 [Rhizopogon vinicolor AM-OR11-026]|uniref:Uncharacterized protein n=1 Tax=Rhizopogon vinicolor AM-OR11-026 TaxID=1314800 RepID=A0A1B7MKC1_9AGAM|nr:hypothetical protein K503DRAFT_776043 [Rhizopogon vinicolor AM-OR11-026]
MKFIALTTMIMSAAVMAGADDTQLIGHRCAKAGNTECGHLASHNNGNGFVFWCGSDNTITKYQDCECVNCCVVIPNNGAYCVI